MQFTTSLAPPLSFQNLTFPIAPQVLLPPTISLSSVVIYPTDLPPCNHLQKKLGKDQCWMISSRPMHSLCRGEKERAGNLFWIFFFSPKQQNSQNVPIFSSVVFQEQDEYSHFKTNIFHFGYIPTNILATEYYQSKNSRKLVKPHSFWYAL